MDYSYASARWNSVWLSRIPSAGCCRSLPCVEIKASHVPCFDRWKFQFFFLYSFIFSVFFCGCFYSANICLKDSYDPRCGVLKQQWLPFNGGFCTCFDPFRLRICLDPAGSVLTLLLVQKPIQPDPCGSEELEVDSSSRSGFGSY